MCGMLKAKKFNEKFQFSNQKDFMELIVGRKLCKINRLQLLGFLIKSIFTREAKLKRLCTVLYGQTMTL